MLHALIFDLDGTLVDSLSDIAKAMNHTLATAGLPEHPFDAYRHFVGGGVRVLAQRAVPEADQDRIEQLVAAFRVRYFAHGLDETRPYPGVSALLGALVARGIPLAILSNKPHELTVEVVEALFADVPFVAVYGQRDGVAVKPEPGVALALADALGVVPARIGFVGDTPIDVLTARNAGMYGVGVTWGFRPREELVAAGAERLVDAPSELLALV